MSGLSDIITKIEELNNSIKKEKDKQFKAIARELFSKHRELNLEVLKSLKNLTKDQILVEYQSYLDNKEQASMSSNKAGLVNVSAIDGPPKMVLPESPAEGTEINQSPSGNEMLSLDSLLP